MCKNKMHIINLIKVKSVAYLVRTKGLWLTNKGVHGRVEHVVSTHFSFVASFSATSVQAALHMAMTV